MLGIYLFIMGNLLKELSKKVENQINSISYFRLIYFIVDLSILLIISLNHANILVPLANFLITVISFSIKINLHDGFKTNKIDELYNLSDTEISRKLIGMKLSCIEFNDKKLKIFSIFFNIKIILSASIIVIYLLSFYNA